MEQSQKSMLRYIRFITDNANIKDALLGMDIKELNVEDPRTWLLNAIQRTPDFCRGSEMIHYLKDNVLNTKNTSIFIHGGYEIWGVVNFHIIQIGKVKTLITKGICVPRRMTTIPQKRGALLLNIVKELGPKLHVEQIGIFSLKEAKPFYKRNGFIEVDEGTDLMIYKFNNTSHKQSLQKTHTQKSRGTRSLSTASNRKNTSRKIRSAK